MTRLTDDEREWIRLMAREIAFAVFREAMPDQCARCKATKDIAKFRWILVGIGIGVPIGTAGVVVGLAKLIPAFAAVL